MMVETVMARSVRAICASGMALGMTAAFAQDAAPMQKVEVTGSRIPTLNVDGTSPVVVLGAKDIKTDGVRNVESLLNNLPQVVAAQTATVSNGSTGTASVNLRGLGANRTLVLVDGKRLPSGSPGTPAADLNQIPAGLIKRIEVLTGGAGAVYGADAVAGVVNFIMNDRFEGVQIETNISGFQHNQQDAQGVGTIIANRAKTNPAEFKVPGDDNWGGQSKEATLLLGGNFDGGKGNAVAYFSYKKDEAMLQADRDFTACALGANAAGFNCGGSATAANGTFFTDVGAYSATATGVPRAYNGNTDAYNFGPTNFLQRPSERYGFTGKVRYDLNEKARVYADFSMHDDRTDATIAPGGIFFETLTAAWDNPMLTPEWRTALGLTGPGDTAEFQLGRRNVEGGGRNQNFQNTSFRTLIGAKGDLGGWNWDVFFQTAKVRGSSSNQNYFSIQRIRQAFDVVNQNGVAVCRDTTGGCVPYNAWRTGGVTKEMLDFIQIPGQSQGYTSQQIQGATIATDLGEYGIKFPWVSSGVGFSAGLERRVESLNFDPDGPQRAGDLSGTGGPSTPVSGRYVVKDVFAEARSVIAENMVGAKKLELNASFRHTEIDTGVSANTYGIGVDWQPVDQVRVRYSHQKAVRAPNIFELFNPAGLGLYDMDEDPCAGPTPTMSAAVCARTGVTAAQYGKIIDSPAGQYNALFGGNPNLVPEAAKSNTFGFVINPMKNLTLTVDYFDIKINDAISTVGPTTVLDKCLETGDAVFCNKITRSPNGSLWLNGSQIVATQVNIGSTRTSGLDFGAAYAYKLTGMGSLGFNFNGSLLKKLEFEELPGEKYDCVGYYNGAGSCGQSNPEWRHKMRVNWNTPWGVDLAATWRHISEVEVELASSNPLLKGTVHAADRFLGERNYLDLAAAYYINKHFSLTGGINNVLDKDPPLLAKVGAGLGNGNTFPGMYDAMGRKIFLNLTAKF
jgi:outer membrane receptor protein involved in Fe transport